MAITFDKNLFDFFIKDELDLSYIIKRCNEIKAKVVSLDEKESGIRAVLNYGHTFAHAIENETNYKKYLHGEAVAIGMNMANHLAYKLGLININELNLIKKTLMKFDLPISYKIEDENLFYNLFLLDKKTNLGKIKFILPKSIGNFIIKDDIEKDIVLEVLKEFK